MASAARRGRTGPKLAKMKMVGKFSPEKFRYCIDHDTKMTPVKTFGAGIHYECKEGCSLSKDAAILK